MKKLLIFITTLTLSVSALAQETTKPTKKSKKEEKRERINAMARAEEEGVITYKKHFVFGLKLTTDGYGMLFEKGYAKSVKRANLFQLEFSERNHRKEEKQSNLLHNSMHGIDGFRLVCLCAQSSWCNYWFTGVCRVGSSSWDSMVSNARWRFNFVIHFKQY